MRLSIHNREGRTAGCGLQTLLGAPSWVRGDVAVRPLVCGAEGGGQRRTIKILLVKPGHSSQGAVQRVVVHHVGVVLNGSPLACL